MLLIALFIGILIEYLKEKEGKDLFEFDYSKEDSLFLASNIGEDTIYKKYNNINIDYKGELLDFSTDNFRKKLNKDSLNRAININTADIDELMKLPGIGEKTALEILNYRNKNGLFNSIDDLLKVKGIGKSKLSKIKNIITVK